MNKKGVPFPVFREDSAPRLDGGAPALDAVAPFKMPNTPPEGLVRLASDAPVASSAFTDHVVDVEASVVQQTR